MNKRIKSYKFYLHYMHLCYHSDNPPANIAYSIDVLIVKIYRYEHCHSIHKEKNIKYEYESNR